MHENNGFFLWTDMMALLVAACDPGEKNATEPACWPLRASMLSSCTEVNDVTAENIRAF